MLVETTHLAQVEYNGTGMNMSRYIPVKDIHFSATEQYTFNASTNDKPTLTVSDVTIRIHEHRTQSDAKCKPN